MAGDGLTTDILAVNCTTEVGRGRLGGRLTPSSMERNSAREFLLAIMIWGWKSEWKLQETQRGDATLLTKEECLSKRLKLLDVCTLQQINYFEGGIKAERISHPGGITETQADPRWPGGQPERLFVDNWFSWLAPTLCNTSNRHSFSGGAECASNSVTHFSLNLPSVFGPTGLPKLDGAGRLRQARETQIFKS